MANDRRADCTHDRRFYALVLLATFASLRWGEATALKRSDLDLTVRTVRIRAAYVERSTGEMLLGPPKSKAGRRIVGIPASIVPALREHFVRAGDGNRTRTVSLGICAVTASTWPDLRRGVSASDRERPLVAVVNGR